MIRMNKKLFLFLCLLCTLLTGTIFISCTEASTRGRIIFIPIDNRPISDWYAVDTLQKAGYTVMVPPDELLGGPGHLQGSPDNVWEWLDETMKDYGYVDALVCSGDTMIYGSLVSSRTHELQENILLERVERFRSLRAKHPDLKIYAFSSIMRTPKMNAAYGGVEAPYMDNHANDFFIYSSLMDKMEQQGLNKKEKRALEEAKARIPEDAFADWQSRRNKNLQVNKSVIDLLQENIIDYLVIGNDDNAPFSQTHKEALLLDDYAKNTDKNRFQNIAGIDEIGMLLLARVHNNINYILPFVYARYNSGAGGNMIPGFSSKSIDTTMKNYIKCAGGFYTKHLERTDLALLVNTTYDGKDEFAGSPVNIFQPSSTSAELVNETERLLNKNIPTGIADISFYNGSDNGLLTLMKDKNLLFKLTVYGGWNTATNSLGFAMGQGMLMPHISTDDKNDLLMTRYLDEWVYEANVRQELINHITAMSQSTGDADYLKNNRQEVEAAGNKMTLDFAKKHLFSYPNKKTFRMELPWIRTFENKVIIE